MKQGLKMFSAVAVAAVVALSATVVIAQQTTAAPSAAAVAAANEILKLKGAAGLYQGASVGVVQGVKGMLTQSNLNLGKDIDAVAPVVAQQVAVREQEVANEFARQYASGFTEQELKEMVAFYSSPLGRKMIEQEPKLLQASIAYMKNWGEKLSAEVIDRFRNEMKKRGKEL
ncbi:MAG: DUF2059 domain-containing protein [Xanthobacteraceae bacterium]|nr:MAG: DUF2059 domain-containing protein [Xanthobacteraceae bacterium]